MRPRNEFEKAVVAQSKKLQPITDAQARWAFRETIPHHAFRLRSGWVTCMDCGQTWKAGERSEGFIDKCICPECGAELQCKDTFMRTDEQKSYFNVLTTCGEFQVLRMYRLTSNMKKGSAAKSSIAEIGQYWWNREGKQTLVALPRTIGFYIDTFCWSAQYEIREDSNVYRHIANEYQYPKTRYIPTLERNGFRGDMHGIPAVKLVPALLTDPKAETLFKAGQYAMCDYYLRFCNDIGRYWVSIKICIRNGYKITDADMWTDHIDLLEHLGKDIHSPKYVCPADLNLEHQRLVDKKNKADMRKMSEEMKHKIWCNEGKYQKLKGCFVGLVFSDGTITVHPLESVSEFAEEGIAMHHCVFANNYYLKENSLILSATIGNRRIETIEVDLQEMRVVQSRGVCNKPTEYHDQIIRLVNANIGLIRERMKAA